MSFLPIVLKLQGSFPPCFTNIWLTERVYKTENMRELGLVHWKFTWLKRKIPEQSDIHVLLLKYKLILIPPSHKLSTVKIFPSSNGRVHSTFSVDLKWLSTNGEYVINFLPLLYFSLPLLLKIHPSSGEMTMKLSFKSKYNQQMWDEYIKIPKSTRKFFTKYYLFSRKDEVYRHANYKKTKLYLKWGLLILWLHGRADISKQPFPIHIFFLSLC